MCFVVMACQKKRERRRGRGGSPRDQNFHRAPNRGDIVLTNCPTGIPTELGNT